jgi:Cytochrome C oxidase, cbb3-type, subunit III
MIRRDTHSGKQTWLRWAVGTVALAGVLSVTSCAGSTSREPQIQIFNDMRQQPKFQPQSPADFPGFADGRSERRPIPGTIPRGDFEGSDEVFYTGVSNGNYITANPLKITPEVMELGQMRFNTYCQPCHGRLANGKGIVGVRATTWIASSLIDGRGTAFVDGDFFDVISHGRRSMPAYRYQVTAHDRWAIIAYIRALQRASHGTIDDVPQELRADLH